jgi:hypothetical protein
VPVPPVCSLSYSFFGGLCQNTATTLRQNLLDLTFAMPMPSIELERIASSLRGGRLRRLRANVHWTMLQGMDDYKAFFNKADFPCLESLVIEIQPRPNYDDEDSEDEDEDEGPEDWGTEYSDSDLEEQEGNPEDCTTGEDSDSDS